MIEEPENTEETEGSDPSPEEAPAPDAAQGSDPEPAEEAPAEAPAAEAAASDKPGLMVERVEVQKTEQPLAGTQYLGLLVRSGTDHSGLGTLTA